MLALRSPAPEAGFRTIDVHEILEPPWGHARKCLERDLAAEVLDGHLRRLASREGRCRRLVGALACEFRRREGHHRLGFSRLSDYTRERLGISAGELRDFANVAAALRRLPLLAAALERGEISWSKTRLLAAVASAASEARWLAVAREKTVRGLREEIGRAAKAAVEDDDRLLRQYLPAELLDALDRDDDRIDGEPAIRFRIRCPRRVVSLWRGTVELARKVLGDEAAAWKAADAIAAEGASGLEASAAGIDTRPEGEVVSREEAREPRASDLASTWPGLDWSAVAEALPEDLDGLSQEPGDLDAFELDLRMRRVLSAMQRIDWQIGRLLHIMTSLRLHRVLGFSKADQYAEERLGISARKARALMSLDRRASTAYEVGEAYRSGVLSWLRALTILAVAGDRTAAAWAARASQVTVRRLAAEVEWAMEVRDGSPSQADVPPPPLGSKLEIPERQMCAPGTQEKIDSEVAFVAPASVAGLFRGVVACATRPYEPSWKGLERLLLHVRKEWEAEPQHPDPIFRRDGWRCTVPACTSRRNLHDHHLQFRSRGGGNSQANRTPVCASHHLRGIHASRVRARGEAPHAIVWELGLRAGQPPLMRLRGDTYVDSD